MYTVIVAEDEERIRRGIVRNVKWESVGFRVIGEAENGADALELVEQLEPDLLITDIRMPFINGIELARQIREVRPAVQIMFLSGYDDFSYAQEAIQYNIISYLLKPISAEDLEKELAKVKKKLDRQFEMFSRTDRVKKEMEKSEFLLPLLLDTIEKNDDAEKELREMAVSVGLLRNAESPSLSFAVVVTRIQDADGTDRTTRATADAVDMILGKYVRHVSCYLKGEVISILAATASGFNKYLHILSEEIVQSVERILKLNCLVGISRSVRRLTDCRECYLEAVNAVSYSGEGGSRIYFISDEEPEQNVGQERIHEITEHLEGLLKSGSTEELERYLDKVEQYVRSWNFTVMYFGVLIFQMAAAVHGAVYVAAGEEALKQLQKDYPLNDVRLVERMTEGFRTIRKMCLAAKSLISTQKKKSSEIICEKALEIIENKYADQELSLLSVSGEIGVSPNYLSTLIKKNTGRTFVELLTDRRIRKARELLLGTTMKIREITEACGYRDQFYFSHCFKKITGMSPKECRRANEQKQE